MHGQLSCSAQGARATDRRAGGVADGWSCFTGVCACTAAPAALARSTPLTPASALAFVLLSALKLSSAGLLRGQTPRLLYAWLLLARVRVGPIATRFVLAASLSRKLGPKNVPTNTPTNTPRDTRDNTMLAAGMRALPACDARVCAMLSMCASYA